VATEKIPSGMVMMSEFPSEMVFTGTPRYPSSHGSSIVETPGGTLLAGWYAGSREKANDVVILTSRKRVNGWSEPSVAADTPGKPEGNPVLFSSQDRVLLFYQTIHGGGEGPTTRTTGWSSCDIKYKESADGGRTWGPITFVRKKWGLVIRSKPLVADGRLLLPVHDEVQWASMVLIREKDGTWRTSSPVSTGEGFKRGNIEPAIVELSDSRLLMYMRSGSRRCIWQSVSNDHGFTWSSPQPTSLPNPDSAVDLLRLSSGRVILAFNNTSRGRTPLTVAISEDDCRTWHCRTDLETGPGEFSYPFLIQTRDGMIHLTYTYQRLGIKHISFREEWLEEGT